MDENKRVLPLWPSWSLLRFVITSAQGRISARHAWVRSCQSYLCLCLCCTQSYVHALTLSGEFFVFFPVRPSRALAFDAALFLCTCIPSAASSLLLVLLLLALCFSLGHSHLTLSLSVRTCLFLPRIHRRREAEVGRGRQRQIQRERESSSMRESSFFQQSAIFILHHAEYPRDTR